MPMSQNARPRKPSGPRYYRVPAFWGLVATFIIVVVLMVMIGIIGLLLDLLVRRLEKFDEVRWGYANR